MLETSAAPVTTAARLSAFFGLVTLLGVLVIGALLARRNLRLGRGDRRGAQVVAAVVTGSVWAAWLFEEHHVATLWEFALMGVELLFALGIGLLVWTIYIAFEPFVRRQMPHILISWSRLITGDWRDPVVGRDVLGGCATGILTTLAVTANPVARAFLTHTPIVPLTPPLDGLVSNSALYARAFGMPLVYGPSVTLVFLLLLVALRMLLRSTPRAVVVFLVLRAVVAVRANGLGESASSVLMQVVINALPLLALLQFGLLGGLSHGLIVGLFLNPLTPDWTAWYAGPTIVAVVTTTVLTAMSTRVAFGFRSEAAARDKWAP
jgi:serine/threonine-protein kinase